MKFTLMSTAKNEVSILVRKPPNVHSHNIIYLSILRNKNTYISLCLFYTPPPTHTRARILTHTHFFEVSIGVVIFQNGKKAKPCK